MRFILSIIFSVIGLVLNAQINYYAAVNSSSEYVQEAFPDVTGMTLAAVGNSITQCCTQCTFTYTTVIADSMSLGIITNKGVSGNTMARIPGTRDGFRTQVIQSYNNDIISIFGGTNDWAFDVPLGTTSDYNDTNNLAGAINYFIDLIESNSPESIIILVTPPVRSRDKVGNELTVEPVNSLGLTVEAYRNKIIEVGIYRGVHILDLYGINGLLFSDIDNWAGDGLHLNNTGQIRLGRIYKYFLLNQDYQNLY